MEELDEGDYHYRDQKIIKLTKTPLYEKGLSTPKFTVQSYNMDTFVDQKMFRHCRNLAMIGVYKILNGVNDEIFKKFKERHHFFKGETDDSVGYDCYDNELNECKKWTCSLGKKGGFIGIVKNDNEKKNDLAQYYLILYTSVNEMSKKFYDGIKDFEKVKLRDFIDSEYYKTLSDAAYKNNTRLASCTAAVLDLKINERIDKDIYLNKQMQESYPMVAIPSFYQVLNVMVPLQDGSCFNYFNYCSPNLQNIPEELLKMYCPILTNVTMENLSNNNKKFHILLAGHDSKVLFISDNSNQNEYYNVFCLKSAQKRNNKYVSKNKVIFINEEEDNKNKCLMNHIDEIYGDSDFRKYQFEPILIKVV